MSVTVFHPGWLAPDVKASARTLHPVVRVGIACASVLILLIGTLFRMQVGPESMNFVLNGAAAWGSIGLMVGSGIAAIYAQFLPAPQKALPGSLKSESNMVALIALMILGFFALVVAHRGYWVARANYRMTVEAQVGEVRVAGSIGPELPARLRQALASGTIHRLVLKDNDGGDVTAAIMSSLLLRDAGITQVRIEGRCASSCAFLALLLPERFYAPMAELGFHDVRNIVGKREAAEPARELLRVSMRQAGLTSRQIDLILSSDHIVWYTREQLVELGIERGAPDS